MSIVARIGIARIIAALTLALAGGAALAAPAHQSGASVKIVDFDFQPKEITVTAGSTVTWTNTGKQTHTATSTTSGVFDTGRLAPGESKSITLSTPGSFDYVCQIHESMVGKVIVTAAQSQPTAATAATTAPAKSATGTIAAKDQPAAGDSIMVESATISQDGWIAVHSDAAGKPGPVVGFTALKAGTSNDVKIMLSPAPKAGDKLWPMLHVDAGTIGKYEFPGADAPVVANGAPVMAMVMILRGTPATLPNTGASSISASLAGLAVLALLLGLATTVVLRRRIHGQ